MDEGVFEGHMGHFMAVAKCLENRRHFINIYRTNSGRFWEQGNIAWGILPTFMEFRHKPNSTEHFYLH